MFYKVGKRVILFHSLAEGLIVLGFHMLVEMVIL